MSIEKPSRPKKIAEEPIPAPGPNFKLLNEARHRLAGRKDDVEAVVVAAGKDGITDRAAKSARQVIRKMEKLNIALAGARDDLLPQERYQTRLSMYQYHSELADEVSFLEQTIKIGDVANEDAKNLLKEIIADGMIVVQNFPKELR